MHLQLKPALRRVWREPGTVQLGLSASRGAVLEGLTETDTRLLDDLRLGFDPGEALVAGGRQRELLQLLADAGLLLRKRARRPPTRRLGGAAGRLAPDAAVWSLVHPSGGDGWDLVSARRLRHVRICGAGRIGTALATLLSSAGVGHVTVEDRRPVGTGDVLPGGLRREDVGRPREDAAGDAIERAGGQPFAPSPARDKRPDLVVLIEHGVADARRADPLVSADVSHLSVVVRDDDVLVGPLVRPGLGPCLRCLDQHRTDRDPAWPSAVAQLLTPGAAGPGAAEESATASLVAGLTALQVLGHLDGLALPAADGATLEVTLPDGLTGRRVWPPHPRCGCHWPPEVPEAPASLGALEGPAPGMPGSGPAEREGPPGGVASPPGNHVDGAEEWNS